MKNAHIKITDVENGWMITVIIALPRKAEGEIGLAGFVEGFTQQGAQRTYVAKTWDEVLEFLESCEKTVTHIQEAQA